MKNFFIFSVNTVFVLCCIHMKCKNYIDLKFKKYVAHTLKVRHSAFTIF